MRANSIFSRHLVDRLIFVAVFFNSLSFLFFSFFLRVFARGVVVGGGRVGGGGGGRGGGGGGGGGLDDARVV